MVVPGRALCGRVNPGRVVANKGWQGMALLALCGNFYEVEQARRRAFVADLEPERRAIAVGASDVVAGVLWLPASRVARAWWRVDPRWAFGLAAALTIATC